jgi:alcohol dehydrogenase YqhD (iron-dependent ADH family)
MKSFEFHIPTKIVFGEGKISLIGSYAEKYGKKLLLVYGKGSIKKSGIYDKVVKSLNEAHLDFIEYPGVKSNPVLSHVNEGIKLARQEKVDFILAAGGGSVIDEAKAIAAGLCYNGNVWDFYNGTAKIKEALPVLTILTIPATASEMNGGTVLSNEQTRQKFGFINEHLFPKVSILDPTATYTIPPDYTAYGAVDAIAHATEGYFTHDNNWYPVQDRIVEGLVKTIMESTEIILKKPDDYYGRATAMWAASLAWNGLTAGGLEGATVPNHMFAHVLGAFYDIAHGAALSIIIPAWMMYKYKENTKRFAAFSSNVFGLGGPNPDKAAVAGIEALKNWFKKIGSPVSFKDAGIPEGDIEELSASVLELADLWGIKGYSKDNAKDILSLCI